MGLESGAVKLVVVNMPEFLGACVDAPKLQVRYMRSELARGAKRIRKNFIRMQLAGPPGIRAGVLSKGKNVSTFVSGARLEDLSARIGISRILHVHEKGLTISPRQGEWIYLHAKGVGHRKDRMIIARVKQVVIPARLRFRQQVAAEGPAMLRKVGEAGTRATEVTFKKAIGSFTR